MIEMKKSWLAWCTMSVSENIPGFSLTKENSLWWVRMCLDISRWHYPETPNSEDLEEMTLCDTCTFSNDK